MHAVHLADAEAIHHAIFDHFPAASAAFFCRLENHHCGAGKVARLGQIACRAQQHGRVAVMAAGVHFPGNRRLVGKFVGLLDRQRVHVGAQADRLAGGALAAADDADHAGAAETGTTSSQPKALSFSATAPAVRCTSNSNSGWACRSRRHAVISLCRSATRLTTGIVLLP